MNHLPFILGAYAVGVLVLGWCALAPLWRRQGLVRNIRHYHAALRQRATASGEKSRS